MKDQDRDRIMLGRDGRMKLENINAVFNVNNPNSCEDHHLVLMTLTVYRLYPITKTPIERVSST